MGQRLIYPDEAIQWHLPCSTHDVCPKCNVHDVWYITKRRRFCPRCGVTFKLRVKTTAWQREMEAGGQVVVPAKQAGERGLPAPAVVEVTR